MQIVPSIDLLAGKCVRLLKGDYGQSTVYSDDPVETAMGFEAAGASWIHAVDLDGARGSGENNRDRLRAICRAVSCRIQLGGGIRTEHDVRQLLDIGVSRLILGTILSRDPDTVAMWTACYGGVFWGGVDARDGIVKTSGWTEDSGVRDIDLARRLGPLGLTGLVYTSIARDGTLSGPDIERTNEIAEAAGLPVTLSGGISSAGDVEDVYRRRSAGVTGVIIGKAIYEQRLNLAEMISRYEG